jgi:hypothetical protein
MVQTVAAQRYPVKLPRKLEEIDSWIVGCPCKGGPVCEVRHRNWLVASMGAQPFAVLQIWGRHRPADPAVVVYGVMIPAAAGTVLALRLRRQSGSARNRRSDGNEGWDLSDLLDGTARQLGFPGRTPELTRWLLRGP